MAKHRTGLGVLALLCALMLVAATRRVSRRFVFPSAASAKADAPSEFKESLTVARDGTLVRMLELPSPRDDGTVVYFHNNRETIETQAAFARRLKEACDMSVLLVEYRGYGHSPGEPSEDGLYLDAEAALDALAAQGRGPDEIVLWGTSLGTGVAAEMARRGRARALVLVTPYTSIPDVVTDAVPGLPAGLLLADHFDTLSKAHQIVVPTLVLHGDADEVVPFWMGERLARDLPRGRLRAVPGASHGDLFGRAGEPLWREIGAFLREE